VILHRGMWSRILFNYDFGDRAGIIPATQEGEISFCAYNTGVAGATIVEKMHMTATPHHMVREHGA